LNEQAKAMSKDDTILGYKYVDLLHYVANVGLNILLALIILVVGFWLSNRMGRMVSQVMIRRKADEGLTSFMSSFSVIASKILVVLTAISQMGIAMTSFVTVLGAAGIAIGMAFSGTLSNFAGGILILVIKPFKLHDTISALLVTGEVTDIQIFNTYIKTPDNKTIILPNGPLINDTIVNFTKEGRRRVDVILPVKYGADLPAIMAKIQAVLLAHPKILKAPSPAVYFSELEANSGKLNVNCWVETSDYFTVHRALTNEFFQWLEPIAE
jgi:small conductance mechanosensitive channel